MKLIGIDIDGTLLNSRKELTAVTKEALQAAADAGIVVAISTGRVLSEFRELTEQLPTIRYCVTCTGAQVVDLHSGRDIFRQTLSADNLREIYCRLRPFQKLFQVFSDADGLVHNDKRELERAEIYAPIPLAREMQKTHIPEKNLDAYISQYRGVTNKVHMFFATVEERNQAWKLMETEPYVLSASTDNDMELMPLGVNKGLSLYRLADRLHIPYGQIMAIGDGANDADMLRCAGLGVAMANGCAEAKKAADHILSLTNDEDGVAYAIWAVIKGERLP